MKVKITHAPPVEERHGVTVGRVFDALDADGLPWARTYALWVRGDAGELVRLMANEYERCTDAPKRGDETE